MGTTHCVCIKNLGAHNPQLTIIRFRIGRYSTVLYILVYELDLPQEEHPNPNRGEDRQLLLLRGVKNFFMVGCNMCVSNRHLM